MKHILSVVVLATVLCASVAQAAVWMPSVFSDNMVLQRGKPVPVWGWADPGEKVTVKFAGQKKKAKADKSGKWTIRLDSMKASAEGRVLTVTSNGKSKSGNRKFTDVLVGVASACDRESISIDRTCAHQARVCGDQVLEI